MIMKLIRNLLILFALLLSHWGVAQDFHYSMFDMAPLRLNPASTGNFAGSVRVGGIYRGQWGGISNNAGNFSGFQTPSAYVDFTFLPTFGDRGWLGGGLEILNDEVGLGNLQTFSGMLAFAGHLRLGQRMNTRISIGGRGGIVQQRLNANSAVWGLDLLGLSNPDAGNIDFDKSYVDMSLGAILGHTTNNISFEFGLAANHILQPAYGFLSANNNNAVLGDTTLNMGINAHTRFDITLTERLVLRPMIFFQSMPGVFQMNNQAMIGYYVGAEQDFLLLGGAGYRFGSAAIASGDAAIARLGVEWNDLRFGAAYDFNVSGLNTAGAAGSFEFALSYIFKIKPPIVLPPIRFCPRF